MLFNSYSFIFVFLPIVLFISYISLKYQKKLTLPWLLIASLFFYGYWDFRYLNLIIISILVNYLVSKNLIIKKSKIIFLFGLIFNLGLLGYFKYVDFFIKSINELSGTNIHLLNVVLPLGISFFTLQQVAYLVDCYEGLGSKNSFINYALFVSFFPQLIAGPIVQYQDIVPQFNDEAKKKFIYSNFSKGLFIFIIGLSKKVLIADTFARFATPYFDEKEVLQFFEAWRASLSYTFQIYFDFSGYSDMAIGLGLLFNIEIPQNFNSPFKARNIVDFWSRWHITLTNFITTYVFTPLVRIMPSMKFSYMMISMFITMTIAGIWHGAGYTFILYGMLHGLAIVINHNLKKRKIKFPLPLSIFLTFISVNCFFVVFRAKSLSDSFKVFKGMIGLSGFSFPKGLVSKHTLDKFGIEASSYMNNDDYLNILLILLSFYATFKIKNSMELMRDFAPTKKNAFLLSILFVLCIFGLNQLSEFIYFNF